MILRAFNMKLFCNHQWHLLSETTTESYLELFKRVAHKQLMPDDILGVEEVCRRKHIVIATCQKCGKIKKFVTELN